MYGIWEGLQMAHHLINFKQGLGISVNNKSTCILYSIKFQRLSVHMPHTKKMKTTCGQIFISSHRKRYNSSENVVNTQYYQ